MPRMRRCTRRSAPDATGSSPAWEKQQVRAKASPYTAIATSGSSPASLLPPTQEWHWSVADSDQVDDRQSVLAYAHSGLRPDISQKLSCFFRNHCVDKHPGAKLEAGGPREPGDYAYIPVEITNADTFGGSSTNGEIEIRILEAYVQFRQDRAQNSPQFGNLNTADVSEAGHVPPGINMGAEGRRRREQFHGYEVLAGHHDPFLVLQFFINNLVKDAAAEIVVMTQSFLKPLSYLIGDHGGGDHL